MAGLIEELVRDASDATKPVSQLLRRMKVAAVRLKLEGLEAWVDHELNGYPQDGSSLPPYRYQTGMPMGQHVIHGPQPLMGGDVEARRKLSIRAIHQSLGSIEDLLSRPGDGIYWFPYPEPIESALLNANASVLRNVGLQLDGSRLMDIVDGARDRILTWALSMEKAGVTGAGLTFSAEEESAAQTVTNIFYGDNARLNQNSVDNSVNSVSRDHVFADLRSRIERDVPDVVARKSMIEAATEMEGQSGKAGFAQAYSKFVAVAANHIQIIQPFLEPLTKMLGG